MRATLIARFMVVLLISGVLHPGIAGADAYKFLYKEGKPVFVVRTNNHGTSVSTFGFDGMFLNKDGSFEIFPLPPHGFFGPEISDLNDGGDVVGRYSDPSNAHVAFLRKKSGAFTTIQVPGEGLTFANGINNSGTVVGTFQLAGKNASQGFIFKNGVYTKVPIPGAQFVRFVDVNDAGDIVGEGQFAGTFEPFSFIYRQGNVVFLPAYPGAFQTLYTGINNRGELAGYAQTNDENFQFGRQDGFIVREGAFESFRVLGAAFLVVSGINDKGEVTGQYEGNVSTGDLLPSLEGTSFIRLPR